MVDIGSENWEVVEQRMEKRGGGEMDVSNWVILSLLLGYTFWTSVIYISRRAAAKSSGLSTTLSEHVHFGDATSIYCIFEREGYIHRRC